MKFNLPKEQHSIIKVIGIGGGGSNAVNHMYRQGIKDVDFMVCNTDQQALDISPVPAKIQLGASLTSGLGAGSRSEVGENAAIESIDEIKEILGAHTKMVFITAGMGGGTGTGAAPIIAQAAKEMGILTVGIVTMPFSFEGKKRKRRADEGIANLRNCVDTILIINNDKLREMFGNLTLDNAFEQADNVLTTAARGIAEAITTTGKINVDFNDVKTVMTGSGVAIMGSATAKGENRASVAVQNAVASPLLNDNDITGASNILLNITYGKDQILFDEITEITDYIEEEAGDEAEVIWGHGMDDRLEDDEISITIIATSFIDRPHVSQEIKREPKPMVKSLDDDVITELTAPIPGSERPKKSSQVILFTPEKKTEENTVESKSETSEKITFEAKDEPVSNEAQERPLAIAKTVYEMDEQSSTEELVSEDSTDEITSEVVEEKNTDSIEASNNSKVEEAIETPVAEEEIIRYNLEDDAFLAEDENAYSNPSEEVKEIEEEFDLNPKLKSSEDKTVATTIQIEDKKEEAPQPEANPEERQKLAQERMARLRNLSMQLKTPSGISSLEGQPAFKRRSIELDDVAASDVSQVSRLSINETEDENGEKKTEIKSNNSFLHDNVD
ncbi:cell division protein FtsZ [Salibacteraceae bacterium]|nr:cell division protein FtsZ [Salibacteraceae bacterium]MDC1204998.1 cell division protein FtsZ [Salibacteraceae bacterium]